MQKIFYFLLSGFIWFLSILPYRILFIISDFLYFIIYTVFGYRKKVVLDNMRNAFPEKSEEEIQLIAKKFYSHLCDLFVETIVLLHISMDVYKKRCKLINPELMLKYSKQGRSVVVAMGHYGNWEMPSVFSLIDDTKTLAVYKPVNNKFFGELMDKLRTRSGLFTVAMKDVYRSIIFHRKENIVTRTVFIGDQTPMWDEARYWTTFLNQDTSFFEGIERISKKSDQPVLFLKMRKPKRGYYEVELIDLCANPKEAPAGEITDKYVRALEECIIERPELWLWSHRRWKVKKPENLK